MTAATTPRWTGSPFSEFASQTVWETLQNTAERLPHKIAVIEGERRLTFREILDLSERFARGMAELGLRKNDVAAIYMKNSIELITIFYALQKLGVVVAWVNPQYRQNETSFILGNSGARWVFVFEEWQNHEYVASLRHIRHKLPNLQNIVYVPNPSGSQRLRETSILPLDRLLGGSPQLDETAAPVRPDDLSMLLYTSGTTGRPKGAMITQSQVVRAGRSYALGVNAREEDVFIGFLPMTHSYGCGALLVQPFLLGATLVLMDRFSPEAALRLIERKGVTLQLGAPAHYILELERLSENEYDLSSLRAGLIAGQIAPPGLIGRTQNEMGVYISSFLGSSEVGPGNSIMFPFGTPLELREEYIGLPIPDTEIRVVDPISGEERSDGEPGELLLSGWHVMQGYWNNADETARQLREGWLHTGDLVVRDRSGYVKILGRLKECINRGGFKIIPSELESLLIEHPNIAEVCVVPSPNPVLGESICACVRLCDPEGALSLDAVREFLQGRVADFKLPDELLVLRDFPRVSGGLKVKRFGEGGVADLARQASGKQTFRML